MQKETTRWVFCLLKNPDGLFHHIRATRSCEFSIAHRGLMHPKVLRDKSFRALLKRYLSHHTHTLWVSAAFVTKLYLYLGLSSQSWTLIHQVRRLSDHLRSCLPI